MSGQTVVLSGCVWAGNKLLELNRASCLDRQPWGCAWAGTARPRLLLLLLPLAELACPGISTTNGYHPLPSGHCCLSRHYPVLPSQALWLPNVVAQVHVFFNSSSAKSIRPNRIMHTFKSTCQAGHPLWQHRMTTCVVLLFWNGTMCDIMCRFRLFKNKHMTSCVAWSFSTENHVTSHVVACFPTDSHVTCVAVSHDILWWAVVRHRSSCDMVVVSCDILCWLNRVTGCHVTYFASWNVMWWFWCVMECHVTFWMVVTNHHVTWCSCHMTFCDAL